ncbi:hypothetical protein BN2476_910010 [Paraburkholderia piptadeniae]|uniref:Uncharacterized protein n=1 Tax=Paraburkholderia piptadeniae TaxID=1701573 RepID=A0A1N7STI9_9BURK|nr:hypothetical protein BN2476_910010 [Paraburkholderia piptadeniae]
MEETEITIHAGLMRRNNFLRENPDFFTSAFCPEIWESTGRPQLTALAK